MVDHRLEGRAINWAVQARTGFDVAVLGWAFDVFAGRAAQPSVALRSRR